MCNVPVMDIPLKIIEKYKNHPKCLDKGVLLPVLSNQKMNGYLKELADKCGIKKDLPTHTARHTFASQLCLSQGVPIESVSRMMGHRNIQTTQRYARVNNEKIGNDMKALSKRLANKFSYVQQSK